jgi:hypothetical protein
MFALLNPRVLMVIGVIAALIAAFFSGVKFERGQNAEVELKKKQAYEAEVAKVREKLRDVEEQTAKALEAEKKKNEDLSGKIQQAMKDLELKRVSGIKVNCPRPSPVRVPVVQTKADAGGPKPVPSTPPVSSQPAQAARGPSMEAAAGSTTPISSTEAQAETEDETIDVALDDRIFYTDFIGLYNAAATRQPERLPQAPGRTDGGSAGTGPVSGRDIIDNVDENGKRFAECREKLKAWQNWARKMDLAK